MSEPVRVDICEGEVGMIVAIFRVPPESNSKRIEYLERTVAQWLEARPHLRASNAVKLRQFDRLLGLVVYLTTEVPASIKPLQAEIAPALLNDFSFEYLESVAMGASTLACDPNIPEDRVLMVNRREVAMLVDRDEWTVTIVPLEQAWEILNEAQKANFKEWLEGNDVGFFVAKLP